MDLHLPEDLEAWNALQSEADSEIFAEGVQTLARSLEQRGEEQAALSLYSGLAGTRSLPETTRRRFAAERDALLGIGGLSSGRLDRLGRRFAREVTDPAMLLSFGAAQGVSRLARAIAGIGLATGPAWLRGGMAPRLLTGGAGFVAEVPAFVLSHRGLNTLFHREAIHPPLGDELISTAIFMGGLNLARVLTAGLHGPMGLSPAWRLVTEPSARLLAIYGAGRIEEGGSLRPVRHEADRWVDSAASLLQLSVGGRIAHGVLGRLPAPSRGEFHRPSLSREDFFSLPLAASAGTDLPSRISLAPISQDPHIVRLRNRLGDLATRRVQSLVQSIGQEMGRLENLARRVEETKINQAEILEVGLYRLAQMVAHASTTDGRGNYVNWVIREALRSGLSLASPLDLDAILQFLHQGGSLTSFESTLAPGLWGNELPPLRFPNLNFLTHLPLSRRIARLGLGSESADILQRFFFASRRGLERRTFQIEVNEALLALEREVLERPERIAAIQEALRQAASSPLGYFRVFRLLWILSRQNSITPKILELGDPNLRLVGYADRHRAWQSPAAEARSQGLAYFEEAEMARLFSGFYGHLEGLMQATRVSLRSERRRGILSQIWPSPGPLSEPDLLRAFDSLGDPFSRLFVSDVRSGRVRLLIMTAEDFQRVSAEHLGDRGGEFWTGLYIPEFDWGGQRTNSIVVRQLEGFSSAPFLEAAFFRMGTILHEYEHFRHTDPSVSRTTLETLRQEMLAYQQEYYWRALHGDISWIQHLSEGASLGWAMQLRDRVEASHLKYPNR